MRTGVALLKHTQALEGGRGVSFFHQLAADKKPQALVAVTLSESHAGYDIVMGRNAQVWMGGFHRVHGQRANAFKGGEQLLPDIAVFHCGQAFQAHGGAVKQPCGLFKGVELGQAGCLVTGIGAKISSQLGNFGYRADGRLGW